MAAKKLYDLAVKTREYTDRDGNRKGNWQNVGSVMQSDDGSKFIMLARWFNPAGVPDLSGKGGDTLLLSMFAPKDDSQQAPRQAAAAPRPQQSVHDDSDIPF